MRDREITSAICWSIAALMICAAIISQAISARVERPEPSIPEVCAQLTDDGNLTAAQAYAVRHFQREQCR